MVYPWVPALQRLQCFVKGYLEAAPGTRFIPEVRIKHYHCCCCTCDAGHPPPQKTIIEHGSSFTPTRLQFSRLCPRALHTKVSLREILLPFADIESLSLWKCMISYFTPQTATASYRQTCIAHLIVKQSLSIFFLLLSLS